MTEPGEAGTVASVEDGWEWAIVEVFGHRRHVGRVREEERFGSKLMRIDIPVDGDPAMNGWKTLYYAGSALFSFAPCTKDTAMQANKPYERPTLARLEALDVNVRDQFGRDDEGQDEDDASATED
ncbi:hypothetical protein [Beijerinckia sp. L45]|uniref:hypothetical protein n=1 Tax=Beijerinckia sp. L45 TaxID=1641855 RepID=UPI00131CE2EA|nr:hypothetical protein [Beijerinckia sp. L45]